MIIYSIFKLIATSSSILINLPSLCHERTRHVHLLFRRNVSHCDFYRLLAYLHYIHTTFRHGNLHASTISLSTIQQPS